MKARFHLPGIFEFFDFYSLFIPLFYSENDFFYDWCEIGSVYGNPSSCIWGGGRIENDSDNTTSIKEKISKLSEKYGIPIRLTFSNSLLKKKHLDDKLCNELCRTFQNKNNGIVLTSDILLEYIKQNYPGFHFISSTTKTLTAFSDFKKELDNPNFRFVVPDFRLNKKLDELKELSQEEKNKVEFLCNEACNFGCTNRKECYESVSKKILGIETSFKCTSPGCERGYIFSNAIKNPGFLSREAIEKIYLPAGFSNYKIEGRSLGSALLLEILLYYLVKPEYQINVREQIYLDNSLDLF